MHPRSSHVVLQLAGGDTTIQLLCKAPCVHACQFCAWWHTKTSRDLPLLQVLHDKPHFVSIHAKFGLATLVLGFLAPLGGAISFRRFGLLQRFSDRLQLRIKWFHRNVSVFIIMAQDALLVFRLPFTRLACPGTMYLLDTRSWAIYTKQNVRTGKLRRLGW